MPIAKFLDPKNDFAFKRVFGTERNKDILLHFLNDMLEFKGNAKIKEVCFLKTSQDPDIASRKQSIVDVLCIDEKGRQHIVEMQVARTKGFAKRAQFYAARAYISQMDSGENYEDLKEVIFLAITDFVMFPEKKRYKSDHIVLDRDSNEHDLKDFSFTFLELAKFNKSLEELSSIVEKWTYFFKNAHEVTEQDLVQLAGDDVVIKRAFEELNMHSWTDEEIRTYDAAKKIQLDNQAALAAAEEKGVAKGREEGIRQTAINFLKTGLSVEQVATGTGLPMVEIEELRRQNFP